jgi:RNA polymerase I-specific transcription initiation factor RRN3
MCFRGVEAIQYYRNAFEHRDDPDSPYADPESVDIGPQRWRFLCSHELQPLKYCLESVRLEFLHIAEDLDLFLDQGEDDELPRREESKAFLDGLWNSISKEGKQETTTTKMKPNTTPARRRSTIISTAAIQEKKRLDGGVGGLGKGSNPLGSFFPFDPYLLQKSYQHIHPYYRNWEDCIPTSSLDAEEDEVDVSADMSDIEEDEVNDEQVEEEEDDDDEEDEEEDDEEDDHSEADANTTAKQPSSTLNDESFDVDFRRSRALSTGSQCSW